MPVRFLISTLKSGVKAEDYEQWVRDVDYPFVGGKSNYLAYEVHRIRRPVVGADDEGWQYIERMEVKSLEQHDADLNSPEGILMRNQLYGNYIDKNKNIYFTSDKI